MSTQLSTQGLEIDSLASTVLPTGGTGKVLILRLRFWSRFINFTLRQAATHKSFSALMLSL